MAKSSKKPIPSTASFPETVIIAVPNDATTEQEFLTALVRNARQAGRRLLREQSPTVLNKGGRPSLKHAVQTACAEAWQESGPRLRQKPMSMLVQLVRKRLPSRSRDGNGDRVKRDRTLEKHVRTWVRHALTSRDLPVQLLSTKEGKEIIRLGCEMSLLRHNLYLTKTLRSGFTLNNDDARRAFEAALRKAREQTKAIPLRKLVQGFIEARDSTSPDSALFSWLQTPSS